MKPGSDIPLGAARSLTPRLPPASDVQHAAARRVGERAEHAVQHGFFILNHMV